MNPFKPKIREAKEGLEGGVQALCNLNGGILIPTAHAYLKTEIKPFSWFQERGMPTYCGGTDGESVFYVQEFLEGASYREIAFLIAHEVLHVLLLHPWTYGTRDQMLSNIAMDHSINKILLDWGLTEQPKDGIPPWENAEDDWMTIYESLQKQSKGNGRGNNGQRQWDIVIAPPEKDGNGKDYETQRGQWEQRVMEIAEITKKCVEQGNFPGFLKRLVEGLVEPKIEWPSRLRRFVEDSRGITPSTWTKPRKRYQAIGVYLPSPKGKAIERICIMNDTSGSIPNEDFARVISEVESIRAEYRVEKTQVWHVDTQVAGFQEFGPEEPIELNPQGGGGTDFTSFFEEMEKDPPRFLLAFSDLYATFPSECSFPVMWITGTKDHEPPFGEVIRL